jgi:hypothetical protein
MSGNSKIPGLDQHETGLTAVLERFQGYQMQQEPNAITGRFRILTQCLSEAVLKGYVDLASSFAHLIKKNEVIFSELLSAELKKQEFSKIYPNALKSGQPTIEK